MTDPCLIQLSESIKPNEHALWFATEGGADIFPALAKFPLLSVCTNRYDVHLAALNNALDAEFCDWQPQQKTWAAMYLRICKEKPANFHIANLASSCLKAGGKLFIAGQKNEGIKSFYSQLCKHFEPITNLQKNGEVYISEFKITQTIESPLDSQEYTSIRSIGELKQAPIYSKPGVYGWNKIDVGSAFLVDYLQQLEHPLKQKTVLDLGCGYGYLTLATKDMGAKNIVATDNNAAALLCCKENALKNDLAAEVIAGDCGNTVEGRFDVILCNPPFHTAFNVDGGLTNAFLQAAKSKLAPGGTAYFIVNSFIPLEAKAQPLFKTVTQVANNKQFKVVALM